MMEHKTILGHSLYCAILEQMGIPADRVNEIQIKAHIGEPVIVRLNILADDRLLGFQWHEYTLIENIGDGE